MAEVGHDPCRSDVERVRARSIVGEICNRANAEIVGVVDVLRCLKEKDRNSATAPLLTSWIVKAPPPSVPLDPLKCTQSPTATVEALENRAITRMTATSEPRRVSFFMYRRFVQEPVRGALSIGGLGLRDSRRDESLRAACNPKALKSLDLETFVRAEARAGGCPERPRRVGKTSGVDRSSTSARRAAPGTTPGRGI